MAKEAINSLPNQITKGRLPARRPEASKLKAQYRFLSSDIEHDRGRVLVTGQMLRATGASHKSFYHIRRFLSQQFII